MKWLSGQGLENPGVLGGAPRTPLLPSESGTLKHRVLQGNEMGKMLSSTGKKAGILRVGQNMQTLKHHKQGLAFHSHLFCPKYPNEPGTCSTGSGIGYTDFRAEVEKQWSSWGGGGVGTTTEHPDPSGNHK